MIPINMNACTFGTVAFWRSVAPHYGCRSWRTAMARFAAQHGKAIAMLADDSALFAFRDPGKANGTRFESVPAADVKWFRA